VFMIGLICDCNIARMKDDLHRSTGEEGLFVFRSGMLFLIELGVIMFLCHNHFNLMGACGYIEIGNRASYVWRQVVSIPIPCECQYSDSGARL
jgi:hypothetical protein